MLGDGAVPDISDGVDRPSQAGLNVVVLRVLLHSGAPRRRKEIFVERDTNSYFCTMLRWTAFALLLVLFACGGWHGGYPGKRSLETPFPLHWI
jgi:hypothetical protein